MIEKFCQTIENYDLLEVYQLNLNTIAAHNERGLDFMPLKIKSGYEHPYRKAISTLKQMNRVHGPIAQLKLLTKTFWHIDECILTFHKAHNLSPVRINDADTLLNIFTYVLVKSQVFSLPVVCQFIENFVVKSLLNS
jgi:Vacuolar sorting protein 9 (VPS9) domain